MEKNKWVDNKSVLLTLNNLQQKAKLENMRRTRTKLTYICMLVYRVARQLEENGEFWFVCVGGGGLLVFLAQLCHF